MMKVKEYLVSEIMNLKSDISNLRIDIRNKDNQIKSQYDRIEYLENNERDYKARLNRDYGVINALRDLITNNIIYENSGEMVGLSLSSAETNDLLKLLNINPEDHKDRNIPECDFCTYSTPDGTCSRCDCTVGSKFEPVHVCDTCKYIKCPGDEEPCLNCTGDNSKWKRREEDVKTED